MSPIKLKPWDSSEHLKTEEDINLYLQACLEEGDQALLTHALGVIARAKGIKQIVQYSDLIKNTNIIMLDPDIAQFFVDSKSVNEALRSLLDLTRKTELLTKQPSTV